MNPYLSGAIILILRWLQFIAGQVLTNRNSAEVLDGLENLIHENTDFCERLSRYTLNSHGMNDVEVNPNKKVM